MSQTFAPEKTAPAGKLHLGWLMLPGLMLALAQTSFIDRSWQDCEVTRQIDVTSTQLFALGIPAFTLLYRSWPTACGDKRPPCASS
ncbi:hypothetical protein BH18ACT8_BH18ACT8_03980 [soil metagenome]